MADQATARPKMNAWFFMRPGFDTFLLQPEKHKRYLFGPMDRDQRDRLLDSLEEAGFSNDGHKTAVYGDYGRGKTHQCHNIIYEIGKRDLPFAPVYVKCGAFKKKEPFNSLFREMVLNQPLATIQQIAGEYERRVQEGQAERLTEVVISQDVSHVMSAGLTVPNPSAVKMALRWLSGDPKISIDILGDTLKPQLTDSGDFGAVLRGFSQMFVTVLGKVPLFIIDEAERFQNVTDTDTYYTWLACLRELTEIHGVGFIFMIGAKTRDELPIMFVQDEIIRRIGVANYVEFLNPGRDHLRDFLLEQLQTTIKKGEVPVPLRDSVDPEALDASVPSELLELVDGDKERLRTYPFEPDAFEEFVTQVATGELSNKPSEAQIRIQKAAQKAMRRDSRIISAEIVDEIHGEGF